MESTTVSYPYEGRLFKSRNKKYSETVLFVPFFGAAQRELARHVKFVNDLGYDCVTFDLQKTPAILDFSQGLLTPLKKWKELQATLKLPISSHMQFGLKHVYADQVENMLNLIPGKKIVFAFSNPGAAAIEALSRRKCLDVAGIIFDSGPSGKFVESFSNLAKHEWKIHSLALRYVLAPLLSYAWSPHLHHDADEHLGNFPKGFKILSIRGWKDRVIPPDHIDAIFDPHPELDWRKLSLPESDHLVGLRDFRDDYAPVVENFLKEIATAI
ncbi:hypothetical protein [Bdellovibrio sp. HCB337]|uniref:hypothetical protein n=1 Tax=Bdellovibrio sp. HCB337 TaxID=3394358 RepID=UPI0039A55F6B